MPDQRTRAVLQGGAFLIHIAQDKSLPGQLRRQEVMIARHFPTTEDVSAIASSHVSPMFGSYFADPSEVEWQGDPRQEPLTRSTRFGWPTDETGSERQVLLFIDYDDTLHPSWTFHDGAQRVTAKPYTGPWLVEAPTLERILRPYLPRMEIVISSLWARTKGLETARGMLPAALADCVIGSIWSAAESGYEAEPTRYDAIRAWLNAQRPEHEAWLALDDDDRGWPAHERHRLVHAKGTLADPKVQHDLADRLGAQMKDEVRVAILARVTLLNGGDRNRAQAWYSDCVLCNLGNKTPEEHVLAGRGAGVLDYVENLGAGATGQTLARRYAVFGLTNRSLRAQP